MSDCSGPSVASLVPDSPSLLQQYDREDRIHGTGAHKHVYKATHRESGRVVAWIERDLAKRGDDSKDEAAAQREAQLMTMLQHDHILAAQHWCALPDRVVIITEFIQGGHLGQHSTAHDLCWRDVRLWTKQLLRALHHMHTQQPPIVHGDVKPDNCLVRPDSRDLVLTDLGGAYQLCEDADQRKLQSTPVYMAPEAFSSQYDCALDVYAVGLTLLHCITGRMPYSELNEGQLFMAKQAGTPPQDLARVQHSQAVDFIKNCIARDTADPDFRRASAERMLQHPFLASPAADDSEALPALLTPASSWTAGRSVPTGSSRRSGASSSSTATAAPSGGRAASGTSANGMLPHSGMAIAEDEGELSRESDTDSCGGSCADHDEHAQRAINVGRADAPAAVDAPAPARLPRDDDTASFSMESTLTHAYPDTDLPGEPGQTALDDADDDDAHHADVHDSALGASHIDSESVMSSLVGSPAITGLPGSAANTMSPAMGAQLVAEKPHSVGPSMLPAPVQTDSAIPGVMRLGAPGSTPGPGQAPGVALWPSSTRMSVRHGPLAAGRSSSVAQIVPLLRRAKSASALSAIAASAAVALKRQASTTLHSSERIDSDSTITPWTAPSPSTGLRVSRGSTGTPTARAAATTLPGEVILPGGEVVLEIVYYLSTPDDPCCAAAHLHIEPGTRPADVTAGVLAQFPQDCEAYQSVQAATAMLTAFFTCLAHAPAVSISAGPFPEWKWLAVRLGPDAPSESSSEASAEQLSAEQLAAERAGVAEESALRARAPNSASVLPTGVQSQAAAGTQLPVIDEAEISSERTESAASRATSSARAPAAPAPASSSPGAPSSVVATAAHTPVARLEPVAALTPAVTGAGSATSSAAPSACATPMVSPDLLTPLASRSSPQAPHSAPATTVKTASRLPSVYPAPTSSARTTPIRSHSKAAPGSNPRSGSRDGTTGSPTGRTLRRRSADSRRSQYSASPRALSGFENPDTQRELDAKADDWVENLLTSSKSGSGTTGSGAGVSSGALGSSSGFSMLDGANSHATVGSVGKQSLAAAAAAAACVQGPPGVQIGVGPLSSMPSVKSGVGLSALSVVQNASMTGSAVSNTATQPGNMAGTPASSGSSLSALKHTVERIAAPGNVRCSRSEIKPSATTAVDPFALDVTTVQPALIARSPTMAELRSAQVREPTAGMASSAMPNVYAAPTGGPSAGAGLRSLGFNDMGALHLSGHEAQP